jgi:hypothetical protein
MNEIIKMLAMGVLYDFLGHVTTIDYKDKPSAYDAIEWLKMYQQKRGIKSHYTDAPPVFDWHKVVNLQSVYNDQVLDYGLTHYKIEKVNTIIDDQLIRYVVYDSLYDGYKDVGHLRLGMGDSVQDAIDDYLWKKMGFPCIFGVDFQNDKVV